MIAEQRMKSYDKDKDGFLGQEELEKYGWPSKPERFDTNSDGRLSLFEVAARLSGARRERQGRGVFSTDMSTGFAVMGLAS